MKTISEFEIVDHGIEHEQYFQGCGISCTEYEGVATGCGDNYAEAVDDALESLAQQDWETEGMEKRILRQEWGRMKRVLPTKPAVKASAEDCHYYLSIRVKEAKGEEKERRVNDAMRRVRQIEEKYSTKKGATEEERQEAQDLLASLRPESGVSQ